MWTPPFRVPTTRAAIACILALAGCAVPSGRPTTSQAPTETAVVSTRPTGSPDGPRTVAADDRGDAILEGVEGEVDWPLEGFGSMWFLAPDSETPALLRVDPGTNEVVATVFGIGNICQGFTVTDDAVWACGPDGAVRIDPATNRIVAQVPFPIAPVTTRLAFGAGSVWALGTDGSAPNTLVRVDPATNTASAIPLGHGAATIAFGFDAVWAASPQDGVILRIDPATGAVTEARGGLARPYCLNIGPDSVWTTLMGNEDGPAGEPHVARIDPSDGSVLAEIATPGAPEKKGCLWATEDAVWVRSPDAFLTQIDPTTNEVVEVITGPSSAGDVSVAFGSVWATAGQALVVYRLSP